MLLGHLSYALKGSQFRLLCRHRVPRAARNDRLHYQSCHSHTPHPADRNQASPDHTKDFGPRLLLLRPGGNGASVLWQIGWPTLVLARKRFKALVSLLVLSQGQWWRLRRLLGVGKRGGHPCGWRAVIGG